MDTQTLDAFQQKWEAIAANESSQTSENRSDKAQRQQRLSLACTLAREYLSLGLPPPPSTAALTGHALEHYRKHKLSRKPRATTEVLERLKEALTAQEQFLRTQQSIGAGQDQAGTSAASQGVSRRATDDQASLYTATQAGEAQPELSQSRSMKQAKSGRRAELEAAVARLRDALQASDPAAGQQAASEVATLLRATSMHATQAAHPVQAQTEQPSRGRAAVRTSPGRSPSPPRRSRSRNAMTQTNTRKPHAGSAQNTNRLHGGVSSRDAACSPPPHSRLGEPSTRFQTRPEWDDSFHLTKPVTPRPPMRQVVYAIEDASPRYATNAAQRLSQWRNLKRIELARSLSPKREVPPGLTLMNSQLRFSSPLGRTGSSARFRKPSPRRSSRAGTNARASGNTTARSGAQGPNGFQAEQLNRVEDLENRMSRLISAVEQRLATSTADQPSNLVSTY